MMRVMVNVTISIPSVILLRVGLTAWYNIFGLYPKSSGKRTYTFVSLSTLLYNALSANVNLKINFIS